MKKYLLYLAVFILAQNLLFAQGKSATQKSGPPSSFVWVHFFNNSRTGKSLVQEVSDSAISLKPVIKRSVTLPKSQKLNVIHYENIRVVKFNKPGNIVIGALAGMVIGAVIGASQGDDTWSDGGGWFSKPQNSMEKAITNGIGIGIVGGMVGSIKIPLNINGDLKKFTKHKKRLKKLVSH
jgi:hypothetical protein